MNKIQRLLIAIAIASQAPSSAALAKSVHAEFVEAWAERQQRYDSDYKASEVALKAASKSFWAGAASDAPDLPAKLGSLFTVTDEFGYRAGRAEMNQALLQFMSKKPSAERAELWLQEQLDKLRQAQTLTKNQFDRAAAMKMGENGMTPQGVIAGRGSAVFAGGTLRGQTDELSLINDNLATYYEARTRQDVERRAKWRAALGAFGQSLQQQSEANRGWSAHCTTTGNTTNCMGM